jgi:transposase
LNKAAGVGHLYLPRHSPDFNSIDSIFSKLKSKLRYATERTIAVLPYVRGKVTL